MRKRIAVVVLLGLAAGLTATGAAPKIDPRVRERAQSEAAVPVFIVLAHQPQREIYQRAESANALYRQVAESRVRQAAGAGELRLAREAAEAVVLRTRQQAFQAIEQAVGPEQDALEGRLRGLGATHVSRYLGINMLAAEIPASAIAALEADPEVARVSAVSKLYPQLATSVPDLGAPAFWNAGYTGQGEPVGILDSGVRTNHPAFAGVSIVSQVFLANGSTDTCFTDNAGSAEDQFGHGTHVAGIVASQGSAGWANYQGVARGIGTLYNLKVGYTTLTTSDCSSSGALSDPRDVVAALDWAVTHTPLKIFNYSYGSPIWADDDDLSRSIDQYIDSYGLTITISAGNEGLASGPLSSPGIAYNPITVGNWQSRGVMNASSSQGWTYNGRYKPDMAAPGTNIFSAAYNWDSTPGTADDFVSRTGTSMAAPHIAGSVAVLLSAGVSDALAAKAILINSTDNAGWLHDSGWGFTNLNRAFSQRLQYDTGSLPAGGAQLYKATVAGDFRASATWNRHVSGATSEFNQISLAMFRTDTGGQLAASDRGVQNVEQVAATYTGDVVVSVSMQKAALAGVASEPYAIAFSGPWSRLQQPVSISCTLPASITSGAWFKMVCSATNNSDFTVFQVYGWATPPPPYEGGPMSLAFWDVPPGAVRYADVSMPSPSVSGTYDVRVDVSTVFGPMPTQHFGATVVPGLPVPALQSPANGATGVSLTPTLSWAAVPGATSYAVSLGTYVPTPAGGGPSTSYTAGPLTPATLYYWQVVASGADAANNNVYINSPVWSFTTQAATPGQPVYSVATVAGSSVQGPTGDGGPATTATLCNPTGITADGAGSFYIVDCNEVRKVTPDGIINRVAGSSSNGYGGDGGPAISATLNNPATAAVASDGTLYIADRVNFRIRRVTPDGIIVTAAGDGTPNVLNFPYGVAVDASNILYVSEPESNEVLEVARNRTIKVLVGNGNPGYGEDGGDAASAQLNFPRGLAVDAAGNLYIADANNNRIRKVTPSGRISTVAGNGIAGYTGDGGPATSAELTAPIGVAVDAGGGIFIADTSNHAIRYVAPNGVITTVATAVYPAAVAVSPNGTVYFVDQSRRAFALTPVDSSCQYSVGQTAVGISGTGGTVSIPIRTGAGCSWSVAGLPTWLSTENMGQGPATINLTVAPNPGTLRTATIAVAGFAITVSQGDNTCSYTLGSGSAASSPAGDTGSIPVRAGFSCPWTAASAADWVTLTGSTSGIGGGSVGYSVAPNNGAARSGTLTVAGLTFTVSQSGVSADGLRFVPVTPCRVADTRGGGGAMAAAEARSFAIPQSGCGIPSSAQAYSLNVTVVPKGPLSFLTLWPTGQNKPLVSTLNSFGGIVVANAAIVPAGFNGAVSVYVTDPTDVILDIDGYFDSAGTSAFYPVEPCRVADTRYAAGPFGGPGLTGAASRDFAVPSSACGLPSTASAYSMNVTVVPAGYLGYLKTWPAGQTQPNVSTLNSWTGKVVANAALVPAGNGGAISVYAEDATQVVLDTNGYFGTPGGAGGLNFYPVTPCRVADTRGAAGPLGGPKMEDGETRSFPIPSSGCGIPATAAAYSLNVTVVPDGMLQYLTAWPAGAGKPLVSTLNSWDGAVVANAAIVPAGTGGAINVFVANRTQVILDINGYFAP